MIITYFSASITSLTKINSTHFMKQCERLNKIIIHASTSPLPATMEELSNGQEIFFKLLIQTEASLLHRCYRILLNIDVWQLCEGEFGWVRVWYEKTNKQTNIFLLSFMYIYTHSILIMKHLRLRIVE